MGKRATGVGGNPELRRNDSGQMFPSILSNILCSPRFTRLTVVRYNTCVATLLIVLYCILWCFCLKIIVILAVSFFFFYWTQHIPNHTIIVTLKLWHKLNRELICIIATLASTFNADEKTTKPWGVLPNSSLMSRTVCLRDASEEKPTQRPHLRWEKNKY